MARLHGMLSGLHDDGNVIYGIGAATRAVPLIHYARIAGYLACVCEVAGSEKIGTTMPGTSITVVDEVRLIEDQPGLCAAVPVAVRRQPDPEAAPGRVPRPVHHSAARAEDHR